MKKLSINEKIKTVLECLGHPASYVVYEGNEDIYFTFQFADERGGCFADDVAQSDMYTLQVHLFAPKNFNHLKLKEKTKETLIQNGWTHPTITTLYENGTKLFHVVFECEKEEDRWQK